MRHYGHTPPVHAALCKLTSGRACGDDTRPSLLRTCDIQDTCDPISSCHVHVSAHSHASTTAGAALVAAVIETSAQLAQICAVSSQSHRQLSTWMARRSEVYEFGADPTPGARPLVPRWHLTRRISSLKSAEGRPQASTCRADEPGASSSGSTKTAPFEQAGARIRPPEDRAG